MPAKLTDEFYRQVANDYRSHVASGSLRPAADIAEERGGVTAASVHRWIAESRKRGHLDAGQAGRVGEPSPDEPCPRCMGTGLWTPTRKS